MAINDGPPLSQQGLREQLDRDRARWRAEEDRRRDAIRRADAEHEAALARRKGEHEAAVRERNEAAAAERRAAVERDLRLDGTPESQVKRLADEVMAAWHRDRAMDAAGGRDRVSRELATFFRSRPAPAFGEGEGAA